MNSISTKARLFNITLTCITLAGMLACAPSAISAPGSGQAELGGLLGHARYSRGGTEFQPVARGATFQAGDVIQTAAGAAMDIDFGGAAGVVRITQSSTVVIEKWTMEGSGDDLRLFLRDGEILGRVTRGPGKSRLEIKVDSGISAIVEGQFRLSAKGYLVLLDGKGGFVRMGSNGEPTAEVLTAPPAVYFSPADGVRPAPAELPKEVSKQWRSKLPRR